MKNKILKFSSVFSLVAVFPVIAFAQASTGCSAMLSATSGIGGLFGYITCLIQTSVIPLVFAIAIVMFVWGVAQFAMHGDDEAKRDSAKQVMLWGIVGLTVMMGVWGLVNIVGKTFNLNTSVLPAVKPN